MPRKRLSVRWIERTKQAADARVANEKARVTNKAAFRF